MSTHYGPPEMMAVAMARLVRNGEITFVGVNSPLPYVAVSLAKKLHAPETIFVTIAGGVNPTPAKLTASTSSAALAAGSASVIDNQDFYGMNGRGEIGTTFLGLAQIDERGRVNSSFIGDYHKPKIRFPGGGGGAAILPLAKRAILWRASHTPKIFVKEVSFVTSAGNVDRVITPLCVFRREDGFLVLDEIFPFATPEQVAAATGFEIRNLDSAPIAAEPTAEELRVLHEIDPDNVRQTEFKSA